MGMTTQKPDGVSIVLHGLAITLFGISLITALPTVFAQTTSSDNDQAQISRLLKEVELRKSLPPERDTNGNIVALLLTLNVDDQRIEAASKIHSLQELRLWCPNNITKEGASHLLGMTNLESIGMACGGSLKPGVFSEICQKRGLRKLSLVSARPPTAEEFSAVTNLQNLTEFSVSYCLNFGDPELCLLTNLPNLKSLKINYSGITSEGMKVLNRMNGLTNVKVLPKK